MKLASAVLLFYIAVDLLRSGDEEKDVTEASSIWGAVRTIALADAIMSLDNVVAVAAAAKNSIPLIVFGIVVSVPLIVFGSTLLLRLLRRFPVLVLLGAALLGWVAGEIAATDPALRRWFGNLPEALDYWTGGAGAALILLIAGGLRLLRSSSDAAVDASRSE